MGSTVTPPRSRGSVSSPVRYSQEATGSSRRPLRMWRAWPRAGRSTAGRRPSPHCDVDGRRGASLDSFMTEPTIHLKRWKRVEYERLVDKGVFEPGDRIELIDGLLLVSEPQSSPHYTAIRLVDRALSRVFGEGWDVRTQAPIALDDTSEPEPDVAVVRGDLRDLAPGRPGARRRGLALEPCLRSRAQGESLCPRRASRILDRQPDRPRARGTPSARAGAVSAVRLGLCIRRRAGPDRARVGAGRPGRPDPCRRSAAVSAIIVSAIMRSGLHDEVSR